MSTTPRTGLFSTRKRGSLCRPTSRRAPVARNRPELSGVVDIRDARTGESLRAYRGHEVDLTDVVFNNDGSLLATAGDDGAARIWDPVTGEELQSMEFRGGEEVSTVLAPSFSPDGRLFAAAWFHEGVVRVLDLASGRVVQEIRSVPRPRATSFGPNGTRLAVSSLAEPKVAVFDVASGREVFTLSGLPGNAIGLNESHPVVVTTYRVGVTTLWLNIEAGEPEMVGTDGCASMGGVGS